MSIDNKDNAPTYIGTAANLVLTGWTVGKPPVSFPTISAALFKDKDTGDTVTFKSCLVN